MQSFARQHEDAYYNKKASSNYFIIPVISHQEGSLIHYLSYKYEGAKIDSFWDSVQAYASKVNKGQKLSDTIEKDLINDFGYSGPIKIKKLFLHDTAKNKHGVIVPRFVVEVDVDTKFDTSELTNLSDIKLAAEWQKRDVVWFNGNLLVDADIMPETEASERYLRETLTEFDIEASQLSFRGYLSNELSEAHFFSSNSKPYILTIIAVKPNETETRNSVVEHIEAKFPSVINRKGKQFTIFVKRKRQIYEPLQKKLRDDLKIAPMKVNLHVLDQSIEVAKTYEAEDGTVYVTNVIDISELNKFLETNILYSTF